MTDEVQLRPPSFIDVFGGRSRLLRTLTVDIVLPFLAVRFLEARGLPGVEAFALAALFPLSSTVLAWFRRRRIEVIGLVVLVTMLSGISVALLTDDVRFGVLKAAPAYGLFGIAALLSLRARRPLMFHVSRTFAAAGDPAKLAAFDALSENPAFLHSMRFVTLVWGVGAIAEAIVGCAMAFILPPQLALVAEPVLGFGAIAALLAWTAAYARRRQRRL